MAKAKKPAAKGSFRDFIKKGSHDQNGEFGVLTEALKRIGILPSKGKDHYIAVEFGAADGLYCSNTADLSLNYRGWERKLFDINPSGFGVVKAAITASNVNELIPNCTVLSIDIDGNDYEVWQAYNGYPDIVVIEINSSVKPDADEPVNDPWNGTGYKPMKELGESKGYFLLCHTGNLVFVKNEHKDLFPDADETFMKDWL